MSKAKLIFACNKCGKPQLKNEKQSNNNWEVYPANQKCECGGKFTLFIRKDKIV